LEDVVKADLIALGTPTIYALRGDNSLWRLIPSAPPSFSEPVRVLEGIADISCGDFALALGLDGRVWAWRDNWLIHNPFPATSQDPNRANPRVILESAAGIDATYQNGVVVFNDGRLLEWGSYPGTGVLFDIHGNRLQGAVSYWDAFEFPLNPLNDVTVAGGTARWIRLAIQSDGSLWVWGFELALGVWVEYFAWVYEERHQRPIRPEYNHNISPLMVFDSRGVYVGDRESQLALRRTSGWATEQVNAAIAAGLVPRHLQIQFTQATTRAEFAALAVALYETVTDREITGRMTFNDTDDINVQKAGYLGVVQGVGGGNFAPNNPLTREQAAVMLARLANAVGHPLPPSAPTFADSAQISSWAMESVGQMQASGIMGGIGNNLFSPGGQYTREQSIVTMLRLFHIVN